MNTVIRTQAYANPAPAVGERCTASMIASFEKKPAKPGIPAPEIAPISMVQ